MNKKQIQLSVCKALLDHNSRVCGGFINESEFAVTTDVFVAFVFNKQECIFDIEKIKAVDFSKYFADNENDKEMKKTNELFVDNKRYIEKYVTETTEIYVSADAIKHFKGFHLFAADRLSRIIVKDDFGRLVGLCMPINFHKGER